MKPLNLPILAVIAVLATLFGAQVMDTVASRGHSLPVTGWLTAGVLAILAAVLLAYGLPLRRYMRESEERTLHPSLTPRRHQIDLPTAFRTVLLARACAYTGSLVGGLFAGQALFLLISGTGDPLDAVLPTAAAAVAGVALAVLGVLVERWGKLPPEDGDGNVEGAGASG